MDKKLGVFAILGAIAFAAYKYVNSAAKLLALKASFNGLKVHSFDLSNLSIVLRLNLAVVNPNNSDITATAVTGNIQYKGNLLATFNWSGNRVIAGNNQITTINDIETRLKMTLETIKEIYKNGGFKGFGNFDVSGRLTADGNTYPVETTIKL